MRRAVPIGLAIACATIVILDFFLPGWILSRPVGILAEGTLILGAFALLLGTGHLAATHKKRILAEERECYMSAILLLALAVTFGVEAFWPSSCASTWLFGAIYYPLQATMGGLLAFFTVTAAYRALQVRSSRALLFTLSFLFILFAFHPLSESIWSFLPDLGKWVASIPVMAGMRGILLGVALGAVLTALRLALGISHPYTEE